MIIILILYRTTSSKSLVLADMGPLHHIVKVGIKFIAVLLELFCVDSLIHFDI